MGILDNFTSTPGDALRGSGSSTVVLMQIVSMLQNRPGGLAGLMQDFQQGGLGRVFQSWVGTGQNLPVSPDQLRGAIGPDSVEHIAQSTGLPQTEVEQHLSALLPQVVDQLTPNGQLPQGDLSSAFARIAQRLTQR